MPRSSSSRSTADRYSLPARSQSQVSYTLTGPMTVVQLIALAGGLVEFADGEKIKIMRTEKGAPVALPFNYKLFSEGKNLEQNISVEARGHGHRAVMGDTAVRTFRHPVCRDDGTVPGRGVVLNPRPPEAAKWARRSSEGPAPGRTSRVGWTFMAQLFASYDDDVLAEQSGAESPPANGSPARQMDSIQASRSGFSMLEPGRSAGLTDGRTAPSTTIRTSKT